MCDDSAGQRSVYDGRGSILVGEVHAPGYVLKSHPLFTTLYERIKKAVWRGNEVTREIKEV